MYQVRGERWRILDGRGSPSFDWTVDSEKTLGPRSVTGSWRTSICGPKHVPRTPLIQKSGHIFAVPGSIITQNAKCPIFLGNFTPKTSNYCLANRALAYLFFWGSWNDLARYEAFNLESREHIHTLFDGSEIPRPTTGWDGDKTL